MDVELAAGDVRLTMGGEPTFISIDDWKASSGTTTAMSERSSSSRRNSCTNSATVSRRGVSCTSSRASGIPASRFCRAGAVVFLAQGCNAPVGGRGYDISPTRVEATRTKTRAPPAIELAQALELSPDYVIAAYEDPWRILRDEANLPLNVDPFTADTATESARRRLGDRIAGGIGRPVGYVLPLKAAARGKPSSPTKWKSSPWPLRRERIFLIEGDSAMGYRLPWARCPRSCRGRRAQHSADPSTAATRSASASLEVRAGRQAREAQGACARRSREVVKRRCAWKCARASSHLLPPRTCWRISSRWYR